MWGDWGSVVVKALRYWSEGPGIDSRWCYWGIFPWYPQQNHVSWGRLTLWKWVPGIYPGVKAADAFGWQTTTLVAPKRQDNPGPQPTRNLLGHLGLSRDTLLLLFTMTCGQKNIEILRISFWCWRLRTAKRNEKLNWKKIPAVTLFLSRG